ncbi:MAG: DUF58 domain-containing protein [Lachnospiraceae bacterium]|nr:DUF58 domain-containing protein [Lachnospiraceae bacterium]
MKRWLLFVLSTALLYYISLIYSSKSMLFLVCVILVAELCLQIYNMLFLFRHLHIRIHTPLPIVEKNGVIPVELTLSNGSLFPAGQTRVQLQAVYPMQKKKQYFKLCAVVPGRKIGQQRSSACLRFDLEPQYIGRVDLSIRRAVVLDLLGILPSVLRRKYVTDQSTVMVLPEQQEITLELDSQVRQFSLDRETEIRISGEKNPPDIAQIRGYQPGDALRNIHWKLTAKQGDLMVVEHNSEQGCPILFFVDLRNVSEPFFQRFYSLGLELLRQKCSYYLVYYEPDTGELVRTMISCEEELYAYFLQTDLSGSEKSFARKSRKHNHRLRRYGRRNQGQEILLPDWEEEYREKYRQISYAVKLVLRQDLVCTYNDEVIWEEGNTENEEMVER